MAFETNADGSTKRIFVQLSNFHGFAVTSRSGRNYIATENTNSVVVIDVAARKEIAKIKVGKSPKRNITWVACAAS